MAATIIAAFLIASFAASSYGCNTRLTSSSGSFQSQNYPNDYPNSANCLYNIEVAANQRIKLQIQDFALESHGSCDFDVVEVYDGSSTSAPKLASLCGTGYNGHEIQSSGNQMLIKFKSDGSVTAKGFSITYTSYQRPACVSSMTSASGSFQSQNYPSNYPNSVNCEYNIQVASGSRVKLHINDMALESHSSCGYDAFEIYDGSSVSSKKIAVLCGSHQNSKEFVSSGRNMLVRFRSDGSVTDRGFRVSYQTVNDGLNLASCGLQSSSKSYIIGGTDAAPGAWPWQAALFKDHNFNCGGSLIDPSWILTAAHCINTITSDPSKLLIAVGVNNIKLAESNRQILQVEKIIMHPHYDGTTVVNDIALIKLKYPVVMNEYVSTVCLPNQDENLADGTGGYITGWGLTISGNPPSTQASVLQQASIKVLDINVCKNKDSSTDKIKTTDTNYCLGDGSVKASCSGDSGGPFVSQKVINGHNAFFQHGVTSFGASTCFASSYPSVYTRVSKYIIWVTNTVRSN